MGSQISCDSSPMSGSLAIFNLQAHGVVVGGATGCWISVKELKLSYYHIGETL